MKLINHVFLFFFLMNKWAFFPLLCLRKWLHHNSQGRWTPSEDWHINLFPLSQTITLKKINHWQSDWSPLPRGQRGGWSVTVASSWDVFSDQRREEMDMSRYQKLKVVSEDELVASESRRPVPPSHIASIDTFSATAITVSALSYSAISQTPPPPPPPQPPNPIHIILQSSSSCSPGLSIFYFPFSPPPLPPRPPALSIFSNTSNSPACLSEVFFFFF